MADYIDYHSKRTGAQIEALLDQVASGSAGGGGGGSITVEIDPVFLKSPAASITEEKITEWDNKQNKITDIDNIRNGASKGASSAQQELLQTGASAVVIPNGVFVDGGGSTYALPNADETTKKASGYIIASEAYVDSKVGNGGDSETIVTENSLSPAFQSTGQIKNNGVYILTSNILSLTINNLAFSVHTKDYEKFTMIFTTASSGLFDGVSFPADWQWANGVAPNVEKGVTYELSVTYTKFGSSVKYNAILTPFKTV
ncbi:MAG: hypothetical protein J6U55_03940 [Bacteroidaceae bacterium]|nr:hypothetical protein [Bacteroidaceae bacterium]